MTDVNVKVQPNLETVSFADSEGVLMFNLKFYRVVEFKWNEKGIAGYPLLLTSKGSPFHHVEVDEDEEKDASDLVFMFQSNPKRLDRCERYRLTKENLSSLIAYKGKHALLVSTKVVGKFQFGMSPSGVYWEFVRPDMSLLFDGSFAKMSAKRYVMVKKDGSFVGFDEDGDPVVHTEGEEPFRNITQRVALWLLHQERHEQD